MPTQYPDPHSREFGVEIECGLEGGTRRACELIGIRDYYDDYEDEGGNDFGWSVISDGTDVEVRTPVLQGESGFEQLRWAMDTLKSDGAFVTPSDGLHVHHNAPDFAGNPANCVQLVRSWRNNIDAIRMMVDPRRYPPIGGGPCPPWHDTTFENLERWQRGEQPYMNVGRHDLNLASLGGHGSIEIRLHEGTLDADVAISWVKFGQQFIHQALEAAEPMESHADSAALMSKIQLSAEAQQLLEAKRVAGHITEETRFFQSRRAFRDRRLLTSDEVRMRIRFETT